MNLKLTLALLVVALAGYAATNEVFLDLASTNQSKPILEIPTKYNTNDWSIDYSGVWQRGIVCTDYDLSLTNYAKWTVSHSFESNTLVITVIHPTNMQVIVRQK